MKHGERLWCKFSNFCHVLLYIVVKKITTNAQSQRTQFSIFRVLIPFCSPAPEYFSL